MAKKTCAKCGKSKDLRSFHRRHKGQSHRQAECKLCQRLIQRPQLFARIRQLKTRFVRAKTQAKRRGLNWLIDFESWQSLVASNSCHYCLGELSPTGCGLDRKDNEEGYTKDNVVPCCRLCNTIKASIFSYEEMLILGRVIQDIRRKREENIKTAPHHSAV